MKDVIPIFTVVLGLLGLVVASLYLSPPVLPEHMAPKHIERTR